MERRYIPNLDHFLSLCEDYADKSFFQDQMMLAEKIFSQFLDSHSPDFVHLEPAKVRSCMENYRIGAENGNLPSTMFCELEALVTEKLEALLPEFFTSREFYAAGKKHTGFLWRVIKLSRLSYDVCSLLLANVIEPLVHMCDREDLKCVPHFSPSNLEHFYRICYKFNDNLRILKSRLHVISYLSKEICLRESIRESHADRALDAAKILGSTSRKNY